MLPQERLLLALRFARLVMAGDPPPPLPQGWSDGQRFYSYDISANPYVLWVGDYFDFHNSAGRQLYAGPLWRSWGATLDEAVGRLWMTVEGWLSYHAGQDGPVWRELLVAWAKIPQTRPVPDEALVILDELLVDAGL